MKAKKIVILVAAMLVVAAIAVGGTLAWLTDKTDEVKNTFTVGDINITLAESEELDLKMVPGKTITKDPKVTVVAGSEKCYLFVKIEESKNCGKFMTYAVDDKSWTELGNNVYYMIVDAHDKTDNLVYPVLKDNQVKVLGTVTKDDLTGDDFVEPTLTFTAYAVQYDNGSPTTWTAAEAWAATYGAPAETTTD